MGPYKCVPHVSKIQLSHITGRNSDVIINTIILKINLFNGIVMLLTFLM
jgi:hypothetical protein